MAKLTEMDWKEAAKDGLIAVGGGTLVNKYLLTGVAVINNALGKLPVDIWGISTKLLIGGFLALAVSKMLMK